MIRFTLKFDSEMFYDSGPGSDQNFDIAVLKKLRTQGINLFYIRFYFKSLVKSGVFLRFPNSLLF